MSRLFGSSFLAMLVVFGVTVWAQGENVPKIEKPTKEFQDLMLANTAIIDISAGMYTGEISNGVPLKPTSLRVNIRTKNFDGIVKDAQTLKANFAKIEAFWAARKVGDALESARKGLKGANDLEAAAKAQNLEAIGAATNVITDACTTCHQAHRVLNFADGTFLIM